ncbi:MAG: 7-cyano-7-deazaguanine synthase QueC [Burkholderiales bacterium]|nr:7-cyano-7-deazaguanine synthase QueC [Burkholderiales bacterium]
MKKALVLFSGGQDSTACLAWSLQRYDQVETIGFNYGQRHIIELQCRSEVLSALRSKFPAWSEKLGEDRVVDLAWMGQISDCALTRDAEIALRSDGLPNTFVPGRNLIFLLTASAVAYRRGIDRLVTGVCETDYSGYPDCRDDTLKALQVATNLGMNTRLKFETPLMWKNKAETFEMARALGGADLLDIMLENTHTCYLGDRTHKHPWGYGCGTCPACELRANGYAEFLEKTGSI